MLCVTWLRAVPSAESFSQSDKLNNRRGRLEGEASVKEVLPTLQEPGCETLCETERKDDPHKLVFFEVFSSAAAHEFHLAQDHTKRMFASLDGKVSGPNWAPSNDLNTSTEATPTVA
jgi:quinol monooxygenase YgiN